MGPRFVFAVLMIALGLAITFAAITTIRHVNLHAVRTTTARS
jgi:hypothetical protein